jgi:hypothetical protein
MGSTEQTRPEAAHSGFSAHARVYAKKIKENAECMLKILAHTHHARNILWRILSTHQKLLSHTMHAGKNI